MTDSTTERIEENKRYATDTIEEIISETHDIDTLDFHYAVNIVEWLEKHHPRALALITEKDAIAAMGQSVVKPLDDLPIIPKLPPDRPEDMPGNKAVARCGECGRVVYQVEGYCCPNSRCPVQLKLRF